jgi:hypothetical protein
VAAGLTWTQAEAEAQEAHQHPAAAPRKGAAKKGPYKPKFFTAHEWATVNVLVDLIIPKDDRSGSATDAGVPEYIDFVMMDRPQYQTSMRGGLRWLDTQSNARFGKTFVDAAPTERTTLLDDIAWPAKAKPEHSQGAAFFSRFRDLTAGGFFSSRMGVADVQYMGNVPVAEWKGCPPEVLEKLGLTASGPTASGQQ